MEACVDDRQVGVPMSQLDTSSHVHSLVEIEMLATSSNADSAAKVDNPGNVSVLLEPKKEPGSQLSECKKSEIWTQWLNIGRVQGLTTDEEIASFLIDQYGNAQHETQALLSALCVHCHCPLTLYCTQCKLPAGGSITANNTNCPDPLSAVFVDSSKHTAITADDSSEPSSRKVDTAVPQTEQVIVAAVASSAGMQEDRGKSTSLLQIMPVSSSIFDDPVPAHSMRDQALIEHAMEEPGVPCKFEADVIFRNVDIDEHGRGSKSLRKQNILMSTPAQAVNSTPAEGTQEDVGENKDDCVSSNGQTSLASNMTAAASRQTNATSGLIIRKGVGRKKFVCGTCSATFARSYHAKRHLRTHLSKGEKFFKCKQCDVSYTRPEHLKRHENTHAGIRPFTCKECNASFSRRDRLKNHMSVHFVDKTYRSRECDEVFVKQHQLRLHTQVTHQHKDNTEKTAEKDDTDNPFVCPQCGKAFAERYILKTHMRQHTGDRPYKCDACDAAFVYASSLYKHKRFHTGERPCVCGICGSTFVTTSNLRRHERTHRADEAAEVSQTQLKSKSPSQNLEGSKEATQLVDHKVDSTALESSADCGEVVSESPNELLQLSPSPTIKHLTTHSAKPYKCSECNVGFKTSSKLSRHRICHKMKSFKCQECSSAFTHQQYLRKHIMRCHTSAGAKPWVCDQCGRGYVTSAELQHHYRTHTGERPYLCGTCGAKFTNSKILWTHEQTHIAGKSHVCKECGAGFGRTSDLAKHMRAHRGEQSYTCNVCDARFSTFGFLKVHRRTHSSETPHVCSYCSAGYSTAGSLSRHRQSCRSSTRFTL